jgi:hypothetical protein
MHALGLATLSLVALGLFAMPASVSAQDAPGEGDAASVNSRVISLNLESTDLYYAFKLLFQQAKVDYTIDPSIKGTPVTVSIKQPFRQAIDLLIKTSNLPITLQIEGNVYSIVPKQQDAPIEPTTETPDTETEQPRNDRITRLYVSTLNGIDIVSALGGRFLPWTGSFSGSMGFNPFGMGGMGGMGMGGMGMGGMGMGGMGMGGMGMGGMGMGGMGMGGMGMGGMGMGGMGMGGMGMGGMGMGGMGMGGMGFGGRGR